MKKLVLFTFIFLAACSGQVPQVTVTSEVTVTLPPTKIPIPTPTFYPQFIALQEQIAASGKRFILLPDGTIEEQTTDGERQTVPGIFVEANGVMTIDVNGEKVVVDPSTVHFDADGLQVDGYELGDDGEWANAIPPVESTEAGRAVLAMMQELKISDGELDLKLVDGKLVCSEVATGDVVCDENGLFTLDYMQEALSRADIVGGSQELPQENSSRPNHPSRTGPIQTFAVNLATQFKAEYIAKYGTNPFGEGSQNGRMEKILIGEDHWAVMFGSVENGVVVFRNIAFRPKEDENTVKWYLISPPELEMIDGIWSDGN
jgi:hypothetical protein